MIDPEQIASQLSKHVHFAYDRWNISMWNKNQISSTTQKNQIGEIDKIQVERFEDKLNNKLSSTQPIKEESVDNVVLNAGLQLGIDLLINATSNRIDYNSLGTSSTAEDVTQTNVQAEDSGGSYARKVFSTGGTRSRTNQTLTLKMIWDDGDVSAVPLTIKESGVHWASTGTTNCYSRAVFTDFTLQTDFLLLVSISEVHQNGTL